jgi:hypothetical protein
VLELARKLKLLRLGTVSLDGTRLKPSASKDKNVIYERAQQLREQLRCDVASLRQEAEQTDHKDEDPQQLPGEIALREKLLGKMDAASAQLETRAQASADASLHRNRPLYARIAHANRCLLARRELSLRRAD